MEYLTIIGKNAQIRTDDIEIEEIKMIPNIRCYLVVVIKDELYIEEIEKNDKFLRKWLAKIRMIWYYLNVENKRKRK